jgi:hypothetical protein
VAAAVDGAAADPDAVKAAEDAAQDDARANALARTIEQARATLDAAPVKGSTRKSSAAKTK